MKLAIISDLHGNLPALCGNQRRQLLALLALPSGQIDRASSDLAYWLETVMLGFAQGHGPGMRAA